MPLLGFKGDNAREKVVVLLTMCFALAMAMLDNTVVNIALPTIQRELGATVSDLQWIIDGYVLAFASLLLTGGILGDRYGRKKMFLTGLAIFTLASLGCGLSGIGRPADRVPGPPGRRRRAADAGHALDPHGDVPAGGAIAGDRPLGGRERPRAGARADARRLHRGARGMGDGVLHQRPDRRDRVRDRLAHRA